MRAFYRQKGIDKEQNTLSKVTYLLGDQQHLLGRLPTCPGADQLLQAGTLGIKSWVADGGLSTADWCL